MISSRPVNPEFDDGDDRGDGGGENNRSYSASSIADVRFWIDHPSLDDLTAAQAEPDRQQVRRDVEECIRLLQESPKRIARVTGHAEKELPTPRPASSRYTFLNLLGVGAFGVVLHARDLDLNRDVAIKILRPSLVLSKRIRERFTIEGEVLARCNCEGIVPIHEVDQFEGNPYLVMGLIQGSTLADFIKGRESSVPASLAARIVATIADAVHRAHQRGILHRDLKPSNVLLEPNDGGRFGLPFNIFVSDFGLAKDLMPNSNDPRSDGSTDSPIIGTVRYMSPEQATGQNTDVSVTSDVFSLGVILYELLTLACPFSGSTTFAIIHQVVHTTPKSPRQLNPSVPRDLDAIVRRCLSKRPIDRYQSAGELADDLHRYLEGKPVVAKPAGPIKATLFWVKRNPSLAAASAIIWLGLIFSTSTITLLYRENLKNLRTANEANVQAEASRKVTLKAIDGAFRYTAEEILQNVPQSNALKLQLHQKALEINSELAEQRGFDEESMRRLNIAHHLVANDAENCQQFELASFHRKRCLEIVEALAQQHPTKASYQFDIFMNRLQTPQGEMSRTEYLAWLMQAREHLHSAMSLAPNNPDYADADAAVCFQLGFFDSTQSRQWIEFAIRKSTELGNRYPERPHYFKYAISGHQAIAQNDLAEQKWASALEHCVVALAIIDQHFRNAEDVADIQTTTVTTLDLYSQALEHIDVTKAIEVCDQFAAAALTLEARDTKYKAYQMYRADARLRQARLHLQLGDLASSRSSFTAANKTLVGYDPVLESETNQQAHITSEIAEFERVLSAAETAAVP